LVFCFIALVLICFFQDKIIIFQSVQVIFGQTLKIVHLGDSYSAGNGARSESGEPNYYSVSGCYRSPTNWGNQFAESLNDTFAVTYINRACSGGVLADILNERDMDDTSLKNLDGSCPSLEYPDEEKWVTSALSCSRYLKPQKDAIDNSVDLVLVTIGGNDLEFDNLVTQCFAAGPRDAAGCRDAVNLANARMPQLETDLKDMFAEIRAKLKPGARIVYVSYPQLLLDMDYELVNWQGTPLEDRYDAGTELRALGVTGETHQRAAVDAANVAAGEDYIVFYDGTKALFEGHEPDPSVLRRNPVRWIYEFEGTTPAEWYHPNELGHENWGQALSVFETFGAVPGLFDTNVNIDVVFVVDTTGSMGGEIAEVRANLSSLVDQLAATTDSYRVAVVSYRDFPQRTGSSSDYPSRVDQTFTDDPVLIQAAIDSLRAQGGGDLPETVFSGIQAAIGLPWRPGVTKIAVVIGDAPALSPEPISNLTASQIVANSIAVDPVQVIGVNVGSLNSNGALGQIADGTGGSVIQGASGLTTAISEILASAANQPFAWMGQAYSGKIGQPVLFDASGSYDPSGSPITLYEWDFDGDGVFDLQTAETSATHVYDTAYNAYVVLRVTGPGGTALASARTVVNAEGFASQGDEDSCELDENGFSIIIDEEGQFIRCTADSLPEFDQEGVMEILGNSFPSTPVLDNFNRANGGIGSNWSGNKPKYNINSNQLKVISNDSNSDIYWNAASFGADQEAYVTFAGVSATATEQNLLLKSQSTTTWGDGVLEVLYDAPNQRVQVWTWEWPAGWVQHGADIPVTFSNGDQFGARAYADGTVEVYKNGTILATHDITSWSYYDQGGYIGLWFIDAQDAVLDDFGGGTISGGQQSMMAGGSAPSTTKSIETAQLNMTVNTATQFWQGVPLDQTASVTFTSLQASVKPQSNGVWGEGTIQVLYDVPNQRIQVWMYDTTKGWTKIGKDIPVKFTAGDTFSVRALPDGTLEISRNGKLLAKRKISQ
jgi:PKD repeat protein/lysophospholipase L1-like esterase/Mg-chelatase subunit ChlD